MKYSELKNLVKRKYLARDGYFGDTAKVGLAFFENRAIEVASCGCYPANNYKYKSEEEMLYYFDNHRNVHFRNYIRQTN